MEGPGSIETPPPNYLFINSGGVYVQSGATREIRQLTIEEYNAIVPLLLRRQQLGIEVTALLAERGFTLSVTGTVDRGP